MYWFCRDSTSYKDLPVNSLAFSSDGSLLSVGFGNTLCVYLAETLRIKCVLSTPSGQDGSANKVTGCFSKTNDSKLSKKEQSQRQQLIDQKRKGIIELVKDLLENNDEKVSDELIRKMKNYQHEEKDDETDGPKLTIEKHELIFKGIIDDNELNFYQKLELFQKLDIHICLPDYLEKKFHSYISDNMQLKGKENNLMERVHKLGPNAKFIGHWKLKNYLNRRSDATANGLHLRNVNFDGGRNDHINNYVDEAMEIDQNNIFVANPIRKVAEIRHIVFGTRECSHLVIVCTENRLLIWNLLTVRLVDTFKLSVRRVAVDPCTSLVAAFTIFDECKKQKIFYVDDPQINSFPMFLQCTCFYRAGRTYCTNAKICQK